MFCMVVCCSILPVVFHDVCANTRSPSLSMAVWHSYAVRHISHEYDIMLCRMLTAISETGVVVVVVAADGTGDQATVTLEEARGAEIAAVVEPRLPSVMGQSKSSKCQRADGRLRCMCPHPHFECCVVLLWMVCYIVHWTNHNFLSQPLHQHPPLA